MQLKVVEMTSYEKMIHILHNKDYALLKDWVADDYFCFREPDEDAR